ncbi:GAF domain-containing protein [Lusitaniella coriacea LEGE 07157]|uniref:histidine kinase n=1 Tax=Lusitaniella coriacea LEGE 07157 TaxID=945747 RepID=A0A8J7J535_9CYAN|nr:GAF domain-containing protein [Lusitaniella coriacea]MBE9117769.1 GAF domain-containing protein [Lusitaniella coriacea LEGE 07157]
MGEPPQLNVSLQEQLVQHKALIGAIANIQEPLLLDEVLKRTVTEVRQLLKVDRVAIFRYFPEWEAQGEFVAESIENQWNSILETVARDGELNQQFAQLYRQGEKREASQDKLLKQFQVQAELVIPLFEAEAEWGILCVHQCNYPRQWEAWEVEAVQYIAQQLNIILKRDRALQNLQQQVIQRNRAAEQTKGAKREKAIVATVEKIRQSLDIETILQTTAQEVRQLLEVDRAVIYRFNPDWSGEFVAESVKGNWKQLMQEQLSSPDLKENVSECSLKNLAVSPVVDTYLQNTQGGVFNKGEEFRACNNIYNAGFSNCYINALESYQARAYVIATIYRDRELWGLLAIYQNSDSRYWQEEEIDVLTKISAQLGVALQHVRLLEQTHQQKEKLKHAVQKLRKSQAHSIQSEKMAGLGQLVAGIAHEINNPINFISANLSHTCGYVEDLLDLVKLYQQNNPNPSVEIEEKTEEIDLEFIDNDLPKILNSMKFGTERIHQIVLSLRIFSRLDEAEMKPVNLHEGIDSALALLQHRLKATPERPEIKTIREYGDLPLVECYGAKLNQVFMHLLNNGIDALEIPHEGNKNTPTLHIKTEAIGENAVIRISDNGMGIPEETRSRIFDPFFTTKEPGKGTGLGLSISYQIIFEDHKGRLSCHSQPNQGTEFKIEIPLRRNQSN